MKHAIFLWIFFSSSLLIAPPEGDVFSFDRPARKDNSRTQKLELEHRRSRQEPTKPATEKVTFKNETTKTLLAHEYRASGRSAFEEKLKTAFEARRKNPTITREKSLEEAKKLWEQSQSSHVPARDFVMHLKDRYEGSLHEIYSGEKNSVAREEFQEDLQTISPFLYKTWRDSFFVARDKPNGVVRTDEPFFTWLNQELNEHPGYLTAPQKEHEKTLLEIACDGNSPEMAQQILEIAKKHKISIDALIDPLVEKYKLTYQSDGEKAAHDYLHSIYSLDVTELSRAVYNKIRNISFPSNQ